MRDRLLKSTESYLQGHIDRHLANLENLLENHVALAEHPDIVETIEKELEVLAGYEDKLSVLIKYFKGGSKELLND
tara:strand:+ start:193 stop:420 length:228 start_codon:yes stop_codon:yes gene_type:complete